jgi:hypothetical protein
MTKVKKVWSPGAGKYVEVEVLDRPAGKPCRPRFRAEWVKVPVAWCAALEQTQNSSAYRLALRILREEFRRKHTGGEIVLSAATTGMHHTTRNRAARELERLGLIELEGEGKQALRVARVYDVPV